MNPNEKEELIRLRAENVVKAENEVIKRSRREAEGATQARKQRSSKSCVKKDTQLKYLLKSMQMVTYSHSLF